MLKSKSALRNGIASIGSYMTPCCRGFTELCFDCRPE